MRHPTKVSMSASDSELSSLVSSPQSFALEDVRRFPRASVTVTLECAGNGRAFFDPAVAGIQWEKGAVNTPADVSTVQRLLQTTAQKLNDPSLDPKGIDGKIAHVAANSRTVSAIQAFQTRSALEVTGLIEPVGETWTKLLAAAGETTP